MSEEDCEITQTQVEESHSPSTQSSESSVPDEPSSPIGGESQTTESRPRLAKQRMVNDESPLCIVINSSTEKYVTETVPEEIQNTREVHEDFSLICSGSTSSKSDMQLRDFATGRVKQLVRSHALCGDDDTRLRPPQNGSVQKSDSSSKTLKKDSTTTDYTDSSGVDLYAFIISTLHKNPKDRAMVLELERQLIDFVREEERQSMRFPAMSSYNRMLIHRVAAFFGLDHNIDQSGQCIVVNRTENTRCPDIPFSSLIQSNIFTESRVRFPRRDVQSFDEVREFSPSRVVMDICRRARSFEVSTGMGVPSIPVTNAPFLSPRNHQYLPQSDVYIPSQAQSFDHDSGVTEWSDGRNEATQNTDSFGSGPGHFADSTSFSNTAILPLPDDDINRLSNVTTLSQSYNVDRNVQPPSLMSVRVPPHPQYVPPAAYMDQNIATIHPQYSQSIGALYTNHYEQNQFNLMLMSQQLAAISLQNSSSSNTLGYQNIQTMKQPSYYSQVVPVPCQGSVYYAPQQQMYNNPMIYSAQVYGTNAYPGLNQVYAYNQFSPSYSEYQGPPNFQPCTPSMMQSIYSTLANNYQHTSHSYELPQSAPTTHGCYHPALSYDAGYGSMTQESIKESESIDPAEAHVAH